MWRYFSLYNPKPLHPPSVILSSSGLCRIDFFSERIILGRGLINNGNILTIWNTTLKHVTSIRVKARYGLSAYTVYKRMLLNKYYSNVNTFKTCQIWNVRLMFEMYIYKDFKYTHENNA